MGMTYTLTGVSDVTVGKAKGETETTAPTHTAQKKRHLEGGGRLGPPLGL